MKNNNIMEGCKYCTPDEPKTSLGEWLFDEVITEKGDLKDCRIRVVVLPGKRHLAVNAVNANCIGDTNIEFPINYCPMCGRKLKIVPDKQDFFNEIQRLQNEAKASGASSIDINAGDVHRTLGGYPGKKHALPTCCDVMYALMMSNDEILSAPQSGKGASLTIRYYL